MAGGGDAVRVLLVGDAPGVAQVLRTLPARPVGIVGASNRPQYHSKLTRIAAENGVPLLVQPLPRSGGYAAFLESVRSLEPDLILCNSYSMILREDLLSIPPRGAVNVHPGKLPAFRGPNPIQWAIIEGERETAVTMHEMTPVLDGGAVIAERRTPIGFADTWRDLTERLQAATEELLATELPAVLAGTASSKPQDEEGAKHRRRRGPDDGRIDWSWSVARIYDLVRALGDGIPPAFYEQDGQRVELERLSLGEVAALAFEPGPGGRQFGRGDLRLVPLENELVDLKILCRGSEAGVVRLEPVDLDARTLRVCGEGEAALAWELAAEFARDELGFRVVS